MTDLIQIRKTIITLETIRHENGPIPDQPVRRGAALIVMKNPYAGRYVADLLPLMDALKPVGLEASEELLDLLGGPEAIQAYGKGAIVGTEGELEHGALWHVPGGYAMREVLGGTAAIVPSAKKVGATGCTLDIPIGHINAAYVRSHFDAMQICVHDAPRAHEIIYGLVMTTGGRIHARVGGLQREDVKGEDGLR